MDKLTNWLLVDQRRTSVICRAKYNDEWQWCVILRDICKDVAMHSDRCVRSGIGYDPILDNAIEAAFKSF